MCCYHFWGMTWCGVPGHIACDSCRPGCGYRMWPTLASLAIARPTLVGQAAASRDWGDGHSDKLGPVGLQPRALKLEVDFFQF